VAESLCGAPLENCCIYLSNILDSQENSTRNGSSISKLLRAEL
jgi:hypothetical protein